MKIAQLALAAAALLAGCSFAPAWQRPELAQPAAFSEMPPGWQAAAPADERTKGAWWQRFNDPVLDALEQRVAASNQDLRAALARYDQARALAIVAHAPSLPLIGLGASAQRQRSSQNTGSHPSADAALGYGYDTGLNLSYEIDLWGRVRNSVRASDARVDASAAELGTLRLSLQAELASDYFALRGRQRTLLILGETLENFQQALDFTQRRFDGGLVTELDVHQARLQVENTRTALSDTKLQARQLTNAIALLVGEPAPGFVVAEGTLPGDLPVVAVGQPSSLLERRPDVAAAERRAMAANADIGVARAAYFPTFSLGATLGFASDTGSSWLQASSRYWSVGPQAAYNLFDGGRTRGNAALAQAAWEEAASNYRQTVLGAWREAEDGLAAVIQLDEEAVSQQAAEAAARGAYEQSRRQYAGGLVNYLPVATAQAALSQAQQARVGLQVAQLNARVQLIKALGGDWSGDNAGSSRNGVAANTAAGGNAP